MMRKNKKPAKKNKTVRRISAPPRPICQQLSVLFMYSCIGGCSTSVTVDAVRRDEGKNTQADDVTLQKSGI